MAQQNRQNTRGKPINKGFVGNVKKYVAKDGDKKWQESGSTNEYPIPAIKAYKYM